MHMRIPKRRGPIDQRPKQSRGRRVHSSFERLASHLLARNAPWLATASFRLNRSMTSSVGEWATWCAIDIIEDDAGPHRRSPSFKASIMIWPPDGLTRAKERRLAADGFYSRLTGELKALGYRGEWRNQRGVGLWGNFAKGLSEFRELRVEVERLERLVLLVSAPI